MSATRGRLGHLAEPEMLIPVSRWFHGTMLISAKRPQDKEPGIGGPREPHGSRGREREQPAGLARIARGSGGLRAVFPGGSGEVMLSAPTTSVSDNCSVTQRQLGLDQTSGNSALGHQGAAGAAAPATPITPCRSLAVAAQPVIT